MRSSASSASGLALALSVHANAQPAKLRVRQRRQSILRRHPHEAPFMQPARRQPHLLRIHHQHLDPVGAAIAKHIGTAIQRALSRTCVNSRSAPQRKSTPAPTIQKIPNRTPPNTVPIGPSIVSPPHVKRPMHGSRSTYGMEGGWGGRLPLTFEDLHRQAMLLQ